MKTLAMKALDYWLGIPLCFLLSGVSSLFSMCFFKKKEDMPPKKLLFIKLSEIGSIILTYPLLDRAKKDLPEAEIFFLTFKKNEPLFEILGITSSFKIITIREDALFLFIVDTLRAIAKLRKRGIGVVFDLEFFSRFTMILSYLSGAKKRVGFFRYALEGLYRGNLLTHRVAYNPLLHMSKTYFSLWQAAITKATKTTPELSEKIQDREISLPRHIPVRQTTEKLRQKLRQFGIEEDNRLFLINPGRGDIPLREWPLENFIALSKRLLEESKNYIIIIGTLQQEKGTQKPRLLWGKINHPRCLDLTNKTSLLELLGLFHLSRALITHDCGLAHLASLTAIKKFILFGPESPQVFGPLGDNLFFIHSGLACSPCFSVFNHRSSYCRDNHCLKAIHPDTVYEIIEKQDAE